MDIVKFEAMARDPARTREELDNLVANALAKGNREFAAIATEVLRDRFPHAKRKGGGATPTTARILVRAEQFDSGKDAYVWLIERLRDRHPGLLDVFCDTQWNTSGSSGRRLFSKSIDSLFPLESTLSEKSGTYVKLQLDWFANINLNHAQKFDALLRLAAVANLRYPADIDFKVTGATENLMEKQQSAALSEKLLRELEEL